MHSLFTKMKVDFKKQNVRTFEILYESRGLTKTNFLRPLTKLCVPDAGRTPKKITGCGILIYSAGQGLGGNGSEHLPTVSLYHLE